MNAQELRDMTPDQLRDKLAELKKKASTCVFSRPQANWKTLLRSAPHAATPRV